MQNLFEFGTNNKDLVLYLLNYLKEDQCTGLCDYVDYMHYPTYNYFWDWFDEQEPFASSDSITPVESGFGEWFHEQELFNEFDLSTPVESATHPQVDGIELYRSTPNKIDVSLPQGQLRRWWCYNLAIAASQHPEFE